MGAHDGEPWSLGHLFGGQPGAGRLPAELLFSDRDFTDADYETLLALDDSIVKKGTPLLRLSGYNIICNGRGPLECSVTGKGAGGTFSASFPNTWRSCMV